MAAKLGVGIIGSGIGRFHARAYKKLEGVELVAIAGPDVERCQAVAREFSIPHVLADYRQMLELPGIEAVSVCVPNYLHAPVAEDCFAAGKHVLCEKPLARNAVEARRIVAAGCRAGKKLMVQMNNRFRDDSQVLKRFLDQGELGEIYYARSGWLRREGIPGKGSWFTDRAKSGGGALIDLGVHVLDLVWWLMGTPQPVSVLGYTCARFGNRWEGASPSPVFDVEDLASAFIVFANGAALVVEASWASHIALQDEIYLRLFGTQGGAEMYYPNFKVEEPLRIYTQRAGVSVDLCPRFPREGAGGHDASVAHFVECVVKDREPIATGEQAVVIMGILDAIYQSAQRGQAATMTTG